MQCLYSYPVYDASGAHIGTEQLLVNTNDIDQRQVFDWVGAQIGALGWAPQEIRIQYLNSKLINRTVSIQYKMPPETPETNLAFGLLGADSAEILKNPEAAVVDMARQIGVAIDINDIEYTDPDTIDPTPGVTSDWEQPGSPLGPPIGPAFRHWHAWTDKATGYELHATYVGDSGTRYIAIDTPQAAERVAGTDMIWQAQV